MTAPPITAPAGPRVAATATEATHNRGPRPHAAGGVLLAVCGVCPEAGASTLSRLIALAAAQRATRKVLLCHTGPLHEPTAPGTSATVLRSLLGFFIRPADDRAHRPRVLAAPEGHTAIVFGRRLARARSAYCVTVLDCGTLDRPLARIALAHATHRAWVLPASMHGLAQASRAIAVAPIAAAVTELVIARAEPGEQLASPRALRALADQCGATVILAPRLSARELGRDRSALDGAQIALQAVLGVLERCPARA